MSNSSHFYEFHRNFIIFQVKGLNVFGSNCKIQITLRSTLMFGNTVEKCSLGFLFMKNYVPGDRRGCDAM